MLEMNNIIFWQPIPSIHQSALVRALAARHGVSVIYVAERDVDQHRLAMGWNFPDFGAARIIVAPPKKTWRNLVDELDTPSAHHIIGSFGSFPLSRYAAQRLLARGSRCVVYTEIPNEITRKGIYRLRRIAAYMRDKVRSEFLNWRYLDLILATGDLGAKWHVKVGFSETKVFPFAYFTETGAYRHTPVTTNCTIVRISYVGQLVGLKGLDCLFNALALIKNQNWQIDIVGDGMLREGLGVLAGRLGITDRISWHGWLANHEAVDVIAASDLLVLPSYYDGWGAVVGEALLQGVPVITTDACGSEVLVRASGFGEVVPAADTATLAVAIGTVVSKGKLPKALRERIRRWATNCISGEAGADYLIDILKYKYEGAPRPKAPWERLESVGLIT